MGNEAVLESRVRYKCDNSIVGKLEKYLTYITIDHREAKAPEQPEKLFPDI
jgi:hypothetical protein